MNQMVASSRQAVSLVMDFGTITPQSGGVSFQSHDGTKVVDCGISRDALMDLRGFHRLKGADDDVFRALRLEIERLASAKYRAGRLDLNGAVMVGPADILLYGFERRL
jgi:hypothetical protein